MSMSSAKEMSLIHEGINGLKGAPFDKLGPDKEGSSGYSSDASTDRQTIEDMSGEIPKSHDCTDSSPLSKEAEQINVEVKQSDPSEELLNAIEAASNTSTINKDAERDCTDRFRHKARVPKNIPTSDAFKEPYENAWHSSSTSQPRSPSYRALREFKEPYENAWHSSSTSQPRSPSYRALRELNEAVSMNTRRNPIGRTVDASGYEYQAQCALERVNRAAIAGVRLHEGTLHQNISTNESHTYMGASSSYQLYNRSLHTQGNIGVNMKAEINVNMNAQINYILTLIERPLSSEISRGSISSNTITENIGGGTYYQNSEAARSHYILTHQDFQNASQHIPPAISSSDGIYMPVATYPSYSGSHIENLTTQFPGDVPYSIRMLNNVLAEQAAGLYTLPQEADRRFLESRSASNSSRGEYKNEYDEMRSLRMNTADGSRYASVDRGLYSGYASTDANGKTSTGFQGRYNEASCTSSAMGRAQIHRNAIEYLSHFESHRNKHDVTEKETDKLGYQRKNDTDLDDSNCCDIDLDVLSLCKMLVEEYPDTQNQQTETSRQVFQFANPEFNNMTRTYPGGQSILEGPVIRYQERDLLDLGRHLTNPSHFITPARVNTHNLRDFSDNRSVSHRLSIYHNKDDALTLILCELCGFNTPIFSIVEAELFFKHWNQWDMSCLPEICI